MQSPVVDLESNILKRGRIVVRGGPVGYLLAGLGEGAAFLRYVLENKSPSPFFTTCHNISDEIGTHGEMATRQSGLSSSLANILDEPLRRLAVAEALIKAGFNPDEPRDERGRWTSEVGSSRTPAMLGIDEVAYHGDYHNQLVQEYADITRKSGGVAVTSVPLTTVSGITAVADLVVRPNGASAPFVIEVKTGANPSFTLNQSYVYALLSVGNHLTSSKQELETLGLTPGVPLPPLKLLVIYTAGPGARLDYGWWPPLPEE
jgi:hypothetical protein